MRSSAWVAPIAAVAARRLLGVTTRPANSRSSSALSNEPFPQGNHFGGHVIEQPLNIGALLKGQPAVAQPTWNAICLADFGDSGVAFLAQPQIPPRNVNWSSKGEWVHLAKVAFEKYFLRKIRRGESEPFYERFLLDKLNIAKIKEVKTGT